MNSLTSIRPEDVLRRAYTIGNYYGFSPFPEIALSARENRPPRAPYPKDINLSELDSQAQTVASFLKQVRDAGIKPSIQQPLFAWHTNITAGRPAPKRAVIQFHAIGSAHAVADAVIMRAVRAFASDILKSSPTIHINSIGDRETRVRYSRELGAYFRRNGVTIPVDCLSVDAKQDVFEEVEELLMHIPQKDVPASTDHLSEASRKHFENVLEFLEETDTPYELAPEIISRANSWTDTRFDIRLNGEKIAWGSRYHDLTAPFFEAPLPSIVAIMRFSTQKTDVPNVRVPSKPRACFLHIGDEAKRISVRLVDDLRHARVPIKQMIGVESLTEQMRITEILNPPYILLMGRKEALEGTVILRSRTTHVETVLPINTLIESIKSL